MALASIAPHPNRQLLVVVFLVAFATNSASIVNASSHRRLEWIPARSACSGSIAECIARDELEMDSESNRRILATTDYVSYEALKANSVPCSRRGASYYNCRAGAQANPYNRGCSAIARCRS